MSDEKLYNAIRNILEPLGVSAKARGRLLSAYTERWRTYHNASHILQMLEVLRQLGIQLDHESRQRVEVMIVYHDAWYKVGQAAGVNELESSKWAYHDLSNDISRDANRFRRPVKLGILATATHTLDAIGPTYHEEIATLLDLDLWGLGQAPELFKTDTEKVWQEYQPIITREKFDVGRSAWARSFLASRNTIYTTEAFRHLEQQARQNLEELAG